ncbi:hypothetical protein RHSIM_Rhsim08G0136600 [Rhododendron simsii]|uniref:histone deacetylase n=1 Tax=Rhododendron simsii TaxID=118357 RepID=A0A834GHG0_RHOSS|nr:hypothetical protein RHSIM_Rhsim08G0136600 [Rhododendron simsii]
MYSSSACFVAENSSGEQSIQMFDLTRPEYIVDLEALPMSCLKNGEAEHNLYTQHRGFSSECECDSRRNRDLGSIGIIISPCQGGNCGEERVSTAPISVRDRAEDMVGNMKPDVKSICGEHKESGILKHGYFASPFLKEAGLSQNELEVKERYKDPCSQISESGKFTAVGFDERMLLHSEVGAAFLLVEMKSHPHPERPDRLRAITASLATAGLSFNLCCFCLLLVFTGARYIVKGSSSGSDWEGGGGCSCCGFRRVYFPDDAFQFLQEKSQKKNCICSMLELKMQISIPWAFNLVVTSSLSMQVHSLEHIHSVELTSQLLASYFTPDTYANEHSARAARLAAGLCVDLASEIFSGHAKNGFALVRPPGHHAGIRQAMGFCLHNNAAVAALAVQGVGAKKVLIVDWVLYISLHRHEGGKFYPGTGAAHEVGSMGAEGYCVNVPWSRGGVGDNDYLFAFQHVVLPIASAFSPDFIIISAGFDAARGDPLGCCDVTPSGFAQMTHALNALSGGKLLVILEGGYNLRSISSSATAVIKVLLGESPGCEAENVVPSKSGLLTVMEVLKIQMKFWPTLEPVLLKLNLQWGTYVLPNRKKQKKKRQRAGVPVWWQWGRKRWLYHLLSGDLHVRLKGV